MRNFHHGWGLGGGFLSKVRSEKINTAMHHDAAMAVGGCPEICALSLDMQCDCYGYFGSLGHIKINSGQTTFFLSGKNLRYYGKSKYLAFE